MTIGCLGKSWMFIVLSAITLTALSASRCSAAEMKKGWNVFTLSTMTAGCTYAIITPQVAAIKEKTGYIGNGVPPELEGTFKALATKVEEMCKCISIQAAQKWTFEEANSKLNSDEMKTFIEDVIKFKLCQLPFDLPHQKVAIEDKSIFQKRIDKAKAAEYTKEGNEYVTKYLIPFIQANMSQSMRECLKKPGATKDSFVIVADVNLMGQIVNVDFEPKIITASCFSDQLSRLKLDPPLFIHDLYPINIDMNYKK